MTLLYTPQIFVSSTILDLPSEREGALQAIKEIGGDPILSESTISAANANSVQVCLDNVKNCDIYILILGAKYGWRPYDKESITELEYLEALKHCKPILVFNTSYKKETLQEEFTNKVEKRYFRKTVTNAFELKNEIIKSLKLLLDKIDNDLKEHSEVLFSNLLEITFPDILYIANLNIDRKEIIKNSKMTKKHLKNDATWFDVAVSALHQRDISFPHDWTIHQNQLITFHNLTDHNLPLGKILDLGTSEKYKCEEYFNISEDSMKIFKFLLRRCLQTKLFKLGIHWYKAEKLFAFLPSNKDTKGRWLNRKIEWTRINKASRTVSKVNYSTNEPNKISSTKHLAFAANFHYLDNKWYLSIKPDWLVTFGNVFTVSKYGSEKIKYYKSQEKNMHVFNHLNFILWYLQPDPNVILFEEYKEYEFLNINNFSILTSYPIIDDEKWRKLESKIDEERLIDKNDTINLFKQ